MFGSGWNCHSVYQAIIMCMERAADVFTPLATIWDITYAYKKPTDDKSMEVKSFGLLAKKCCCIESTQLLYCIVS